MLSYGMLLRVLDAMDSIYLSDITNITAKVRNLRYLACSCMDWSLPASIYNLRNLQTLITNYGTIYLKPEIWKMTQLRHVQSWRMVLSEPPSEESFMVLENLRTLSDVVDFRCTEDILKRIPNLKKLGISYDPDFGFRYGLLDSEYYCLNNLVHLHQLESLKCSFFMKSPSFLHYIIFPPSLKKLTLSTIFIPWEDMTIIGSLLNLEVLKLKYNAFDGPEWEPNEGEFLQLKYLLLQDIDLVHWRADRIHFPSLQHLVLRKCRKMKEIPSGVGEIPTLQMIEVHYCNTSLVSTAKQIEEEQRSFGNDGLQVRIW
ncbi:Hypothetical predicted protein [Olea europaea subsp. europaea]|uniref:Disease resistance R13L4/SHOC-2-like LRR domain-containing protein n=1 Tax=Olea europaea subsp. europaea TaxID=158383 RepID=A0A8S0R978_OLEEU|nr:Hypothetical predicted protein [Olea europaea subsp. europaea]